MVNDNKNNEKIQLKCLEKWQATFVASMSERVFQTSNLAGISGFYSYSTPNSIYSHVTYTFITFVVLNNLHRKPHMEYGSLLFNSIQYMFVYCIQTKVFKHTHLYFFFVIICCSQFQLYKQTCETKTEVLFHFYS